MSRPIEDASADKRRRVATKMRHFPCKINYPSSHSELGGGWSLRVGRSTHVAMRVSEVTQFALRGRTITMIIRPSNPVALLRSDPPSSIGARNLIKRTSANAWPQYRRDHVNRRINLTIVRERKRKRWRERKRNIAAAAAAATDRAASKIILALTILQIACGDRCSFTSDGKWRYNTEP